MIYPLLPQFLVLLGANAATIGLIEGIAEATASLFKSFFGKWSDRRKHRKPFIFFGYGLSTIAKPLLIFAQGWGTVLVVKFAERMGKAARTPARDALLSTSVDPDNKGRDFGIQRAMDKIGSVGGPLLAMLILYFSPENLRLVFLLSVIPAMIALVFIPFVQENREVLKQAEKQAEKRSTHILRNREFLLFLTANILFTLGNSSNAFLLLKAGEVGVSLLLLPLLWVVYNAVCAVSAPIFGSLSDRIGRRVIIGISFLFYALMYVCFAYVESVWAIWVLFATYGIYYGLSKGVYSAYLTELTSVEERGTAFGIFDAGVGLALLPASLLTGFLWDSYGSETAFLTGASFAMGGFILFLFGAKKKNEIIT